MYLIIFSKNKMKIGAGRIFYEEKLHPSLLYGFENPEVLVSKKTKYQKVAVIRNPKMGKVLLLNDIVCLSEEDARVYHETIVHPVLFTAKKAEKVLIIGGGNGSALREIIKHKSVREIHLVEKDREMIKICKKYFPEISKKSFDDRRLKFFHQAAEKFIKNKREFYDVIIMDTLDFIEPNQNLFWSDFVQDTYAALKNGGVFARPLGSMALQPYEVGGSYKQTQVVFKNNVQALLTAITSYLGGYFIFALGIKNNKNYKKLSTEAVKKYKKSGIKTDWYDAGTHQSLAVLPPYIEEMLAEEKYGEEIIIDMPKMPAPNFSRLAQWSEKTCRNINMIAFGRPMTSYPKWTPDSSFVQYIETSAISYRWLERTGAANIFTCAPLPVDKAVDFTLKFFNTNNAVCWYLPRGSFKKLTEIKRDTRIYQMFSSQKSEKALNPKILDFEKLESFKPAAPAFELVLDLYECDFKKISSGREVAKWADDFSKKFKLKSLGYPDAPDFGHAKKKTSGPSVAHFFEGGANVSHYSNNWLAIMINIVSRKSYNLKKAVEFSMDYFQAKRAVGWIIPRGLKINSQKIADKSYIFEVFK